ncbi:hypothetical protein C8C83_2291 [Flavobacterium sp. 90]|uniref:hypothetical protein n=1 Tax=unclassified Flavobacterium TaxID=196869 RepID=UPI000F188867|nr:MULTISPECIES: hypothetical protein [unclassified Flavobacterium]RKR10614.1 hypothetical protein C8C82_2596 [Flavobacterium sp. 81]TCK54397.1 hypothetical protein C8C83_2291 [Flavobacterium sp. 90]
MKVIRTILLAAVLLLVESSYADPSNMPPPGTAQATAAPPVGGAPIDQNLVFLMIAGLSLGTVFIYRNKIKKASV